MNIDLFVCNSSYSFYLNRKWK